MRVIGIAAVLSILIAAAPISAPAETIIESFSLTVPPSVVPSNVSNPLNFAMISSTPFPLFNSTIGTIDSVSATITGSLSWASIAENPALQFLLLGGLSNFDIANFTTVGTLDLNLSGVDTPGTDFVGTGTANVFLDYITANPTNTGLIESNAPLTGSITYTYTLPTETLSVPEPSTWAMMLLGFAGLGYFGYKTSRRTGSAAA